MHLKSGVDGSDVVNGFEEGIEVVPTNPSALGNLLLLRHAVVGEDSQGVAGHHFHAVVVRVKKSVFSLTACNETNNELKHTFKNLKFFKYVKKIALCA